MATGGVGPPTEEHREAPGPDGSRDETERRIDNMNFMTTIKEGKTLGIDFKSNRAEKLHERQWLIKWKTMCSATTDIKPADILRTIEDDASLDTVIRNDLIVEFERAEQLQIQMVQSNDKMLTDQLEKNGYGNDELFKEEIKKLTEAKAPVLVLGETGSGKTSFINLLLGANYFQHSILSNTHVVSKIQYGPKPKAILYDLKHKTEKEIADQADLKTFKDQLSDHVTRSQKNGKPVYSQADIYLPCEILKCGLVIVDSPGIGENDEMKQMVLDYILTACTFIYVIDSMTAGGVQMRMRELLNEAYKKAMEEDKIYNPATAIFICNKWDMVPKEHKVATWNDTIRKIKEGWPYCNTEEQIFLFSTHEAAYIQDLGGVAPKYLTLLHKINELLPLGREMLIRKSYNKLERFYSRMLMIMWSFMHQKDESDFQRQTRIGRIKARLKRSDKSIKEYFDKLRKWLEDEKTKHAVALKTYLKGQQSISEICTIPDSQLPKAREWEKASVEIQLLVGDNVQNQMTKWVDKKTPFQNVALDLYGRINKEFKNFKNEISEIQIEISPFKARAVHFQSETEEEFSLLPKLLTDQLEGSVLKKIGLGTLLSPAMLVSVVVRGPYKLGLMVKNAISDSLQQSKYSKLYSENADKKQIFCEDYAKEVVTRVLDSVDYNDIIRENIGQSFTLLNKLEKRMLQAVKQDEDLLKTLQQENRSAKDITDTYQPLIERMEQGLNALHAFGVKGFGKCEDIVLQDLQKLEPAVWTAAQMSKATSVKPFQTRNNPTVFVRKPNASDKVTYLERIKVLTAYRNLSHTSLVECFGIVEIKRIRCQVMPSLVQSLRSFMSYVRDADKTKDCSRALKDVTSGLEYLHGKGFVHFDLSLDTVFTDCHGQFKLTNIHPETSVRIPLLRSAEGFVYPAHYVHLPLRFLRSSHEPAIPYTARDDVYSLGIMMWEMFLGGHLVALGSKLNQGLGESEFQVGGRLEPGSQHSTHELAGGISGADEAHIFKLLHQTLKKQIEARKKELKSRKLSDEFWKKWRSILLGCIEQTHSVNQIAGELNSLEIV